MEKYFRKDSAKPIGYDGRVEGIRAKTPSGIEEVARMLACGSGGVARANDTYNTEQGEKSQR